MLINQGIIYMLISAGISAFSSTFTKILTQDISSLEVVFFRNSFGLFIMLYILYKNPATSEGGEIFLLFIRGFLGFLGILLFFYTIETLPLGVAITLNKTSPIFGAIFSFLFISEKLKKHHILAMFIGFCGVVFITQPFDFNINANMLLGIIGGIIAGLAYTSIRKLRAFYDTREILLSFCLIGSLFPFILLCISPFISIPKGLEFMFAIFIMPSGFMWIWIILLGFSAIISQYFMTKAYENTKIGIAGTIAYANIPFAIFLGVLLGDNIPSLLTISGIGLIILGGILISLKK